MKQNINEGYVFTATLRQVFGYAFGLVTIAVTVMGIYYTFKTNANTFNNEKLIMQIDINSLKEDVKASKAERKAMGLQINTLEIQMNDLKSKAK